MSRGVSERKAAEAQRLSVLAKDVMMNKQVFLMEGSGRFFKEYSPDGGQHCSFKLPISLEAPYVTAVI
ncbi:hypothetical protein QQF64_024324 [Cirrhinus molitorella]|uniref:Uncharacterized protein n=1 Tax=Cirrhinus molitorella TaxID=172907 RepID=A0ABR3NLJ0_9TELE